MTLDALLAAFKSRAWYPVAGIGLFLLLDVLKRVRLDWASKVPVGWRWLVPIGLSGATGFVDAYVRDLTWQNALVTTLYAMVAMGLPAMGTQGGLVESKLTGGGMWGGPGGGPIPPKDPYRSSADPQEDIPTDPPPPVALSRLHEWWGRHALGVWLIAFWVCAAGLLFTTAPGCAGGDKAQAAMVQRTEALALNGATLAFEIVKAEERHRVDAIAKPTPDELAVMDRRLEQIKRVEEALNLAQDYVGGKKEGSSRKALGDALEVLTLLVDELKEDGVKLPERAVEGLKLAALFVKVGGS